MATILTPDSWEGFIWFIIFLCKFSLLKNKGFQYHKTKKISSLNAIVELEFLYHLVVPIDLVCPHMFSSWHSFWMPKLTGIPRLSLFQAYLPICGLPLYFSIKLPNRVFWVIYPRAYSFRMPKLTRVSKALVISSLFAYLWIFQFSLNSLSTLFSNHLWKIW